MDAKIKFTIGILLALIGIYLLVPRSWLADYGAPAFGFGRFLLPVLLGVIPVLLIAIGLLLAWAQWEEMKEEERKKN